MYKYIPVALLAFMLFGCSKPTIELHDFDKEVWNRDKNGCGGERKPLVEAIINQQEKLLGAEQKQITDLLGKPDMHQLYQRSQYFLVYSVDPGSSCADYSSTHTANLSIRFNALGRVAEVIYYP